MNISSKYLASAICVCCYIIPTIASQEKELDSDVNMQKMRNFFEYKRRESVADNPKAQFDYGFMYAGDPESQVIAAQWFQLAAEQGYAKAQYELGCMYTSGQGVGINCIEALKWFKMAAEQKHVASQYELGLIYEDGQGVDRSYNEALKWFGKAKKQYHVKASEGVQRILKILNNKKEDQNQYLRDTSSGASSTKRLNNTNHVDSEQINEQKHKGKSKTPLLENEKYFYWLERAQYQEDPEAWRELGKLYEIGKGIGQNYAEAMNWYLKAADQNDLDAQTNVGKLYYYGLGVQKDYTEAMKWFRIAGDRGHANAQYLVGTMYAQSEGVAKNIIEAVKWYHVSANQGHASAQYELGFMHATGKGVPQNLIEAQRWYGLSALCKQTELYGAIKESYDENEEITDELVEAIKLHRLAADRGQASAQFNLGVLYHTGFGFKQNYTAAMKWYLKAANQNYAEAKCFIGLLYYKGSGVNKDYTKAMEWFSLAAAQEHADAQFHIGTLYYCGYGVKQDCEEARRWYLKASEQKHVMAVSLLADAKLWISITSKSENVTVEKKNEKNISSLSSIELEIKKEILEPSRENIKQLQPEPDLHEDNSSNKNNNNTSDITLEHNIKQEPKDTTESKKLEVETVVAEEKGKTVATEKENEHKDVGGFAEKKRIAQKKAEEAAVLNYYAWEHASGSNGAEKNYEKAFKLYLAAANMGNAEAQKSVGYCYQLEGDDIKSFEWYLKAYNQNNEDAKKAFPFACWAAANKGCAEAQYQLYVLYTTGQYPRTLFTLKSYYQLALEWLKKAASQNHEEAIIALKKIAGA